jgi:hypothetical protein
LEKPEHRGIEPGAADSNTASRNPIDSDAMRVDNGAPNTSATMRVGTTTSATRTRIEANIAASQNARNSSNISTHFTMEELLNARIDLGFNSNRKRAQNFAIADFNIDGVQGRLFALSGKNSPSSTVGIPEARQFETTFINGTDRAWDTEVKILETLGAQSNANSSGTIRLLSELEVCGSCSGVIQQFEKLYPGVKVKPETGPYPKKQRFSK